MCREEIVDLIDRKKSLYRQIYENKLKHAEIEGELWLKAEEEQAPIRELLAENKAHERTLDGKLLRSHRFGRKYITYEGAPSMCLECYIENELLSDMVEAGSKLGNDIKDFKCEVCSYELQMAPPIW